MQSSLLPSSWCTLTKALATLGFTGSVALSVHDRSDRTITPLLETSLTNGHPAELTSTPSPADLQRDGEFLEHCWAPHPPHAAPAPDDTILLTDRSDATAARFVVAHDQRRAVLLRASPDPDAALAPAAEQLTELIRPNAHAIARAIADDRSRRAAWIEGYLCAVETIDPITVIVDANARVLHATPLARAALEARTIASLGPDRRLRLPRTKDDQGTEGRLLKILQETAPATTGSTHIPLAAPTADGTAGPAWIIEVRPCTHFTDPLARAIAGPEQWPVAGLVFRDRERTLGVDTATLRTVLGLTRTEASVVEGLFAGTLKRAEPNAQSLSRDSVRFHLKSIFRKTGARSQTQLIVLMASFFGVRANAPPPDGQAGAQ